MKQYLENNEVYENIKMFIIFASNGTFYLSQKLKNLDLFLENKIRKNRNGKISGH